MTQKRVPLSSIRTLTLFADRKTAARRTSPIPQLRCLGKACRLYQPDVVQCRNMGDDGAGGAQWKCEADLPNGMRFGKLDVSCEGWTGPGDTNVLQGSCGLEYNLVRINPAVERGSDPSLNTTSWFDRIFNLIFFGILFIVLYSFLRSIIASIAPRWAPPPLWRGHGGGGPPGGGGPGGGPGGGRGPGGSWGWGSPRGSNPPPPPYSKDPPPTANGSTAQAGWTPGFWTGLTAGGVATYLANRNTQQQQQQQQHNTGGWQWRSEYGPSFRQRPTAWGGNDRDDWDRGEGSSTGLRRATGFGGTTTR